MLLWHRHMLVVVVRNVLITEQRLWDARPWQHVVVPHRESSAVKDLRRQDCKAWHSCCVTQLSHPDPNSCCLDFQQHAAETWP
jgi:hypothetical protein